MFIGPLHFIKPSVLLALLTWIYFSVSWNRLTAMGSGQYSLAGSEETKARPYIARLLNEFHRLLMKLCCEYKIASLAYCHFNGTLHFYVSGSLYTHHTSGTLWFSSEKLLKFCKHNLKSLGNCSFIFIAQTVWNSLPVSWNLTTLSDFKAQLKTFLFEQAVPQI